MIKKYFKILFFLSFQNSIVSIVQSVMKVILNVKFFVSELTIYEIVLDERQENIHKWDSISGDRFNASMKKAILLDKVSSSKRVPLQM